MANKDMLICIKENDKLEKQRIYIVEEIAGELVKVKGVEEYFNKQEYFSELHFGGIINE